jgi:hypothetical protein
MRVYRWDLDKTYLDTDFHSLRGVIRAATEPAHRKRALPGAGALLRSLSGQEHASVMVVSGSPRQMHSVLSEKLRLDGIRFDELVLKDNLGNVRRGRFRAIKGQIGYKLPALLSARLRTPEGAKEVLFGDDVEADALVYSLYADAIAGRVGSAEVSRVMEKAGAYPDEITGPWRLWWTFRGPMRSSGCSFAKSAGCPLSVLLRWGDGSFPSARGGKVRWCWPKWVICRTPQSPL